MERGFEVKKLNVMQVFDNDAKKVTTAVYATTPTGHKRMNVDGKFYTDKQFAKKFVEVGNDDTLSWKVHTNRFTEELCTNLHNAGILQKPLNIFRQLLVRAGEEAARINDHRLNKVAILLGLYSMSDPDSPDYDPESVRRILANDLTVYDK